MADSYMPKAGKRRLTKSEIQRIKYSMYGIEHVAYSCVKSTFMYSRLEDRIRTLGEKALAHPDSPELSSIIEELRAALREHTERLRQRLRYPISPDRRRD